MTAEECKNKYGIEVSNKEFFESLNEKEQLDIIEIRLDIRKKLRETMKEKTNG